MDPREIGEEGPSVASAAAESSQGNQSAAVSPAVLATRGVSRGELFALGEESLR